jgi:putative Mn2+ efflux pump MntP
MDALNLLGVAWALAMDAFAVATAVSAGLPRLTFRHMFRLSWHFGFFQAAMPVVGWFGGVLLSSVVAQLTHWIAFLLLAFLGLRMIWESRRPEKEGVSYDPTRGWSLVGLSVATSIDALSVGVSLGLVGRSIWLPAIVIGLFAMGLTYVGTQVGRKVGPFLGPWAERIGGVVLIGVGIRLLVQHLAGSS